VPVLVIADQVDAAVAAGQGRHAVVVGGDGALPGAQRVALSGQDPVAETFRQVQQAVRVGDQRAVAAVTEVLGGEVLGGGGRTREEFGQRPGEGDARSQGTGAGEDLTAGRGHGVTFLLADRDGDPAVSITRRPPREPRA
jgi:hypothetical protein